MMSVSGSVCCDAARLTQRPLYQPLPPLVYSCQGDDDTDIVLNCQGEICKETLCSLSLMDVGSVAVFIFVPLRSLLLTFHTMLLLVRGLKSELFI